MKLCIAVGIDQGHQVHVKLRRYIHLSSNLGNSSVYVSAGMINALYIATDFDKPTHRACLMIIVRGIALEILEEAISLGDWICSPLCERLVKSSICTLNAQLKHGRKATEILVFPQKKIGK